MADPQPKRAKFTGASSSTISKSRGRKQGTESPPLPSSDSQEKINVPSESGANSGPSASYASYTSVTGNNYYVFLSFRGSDTRKGFVDHLYHKLVDVGLHHPNFVFRDDEDLSFGENIGENLFSAIERSKVSIPVISENYAASKWCLRELIKIMECKESRGQIVLPVLYKVEPNDVQNMLGKFGDAFRRRKYRFDKEFKLQGKEALKEAVASRIFESEKFARGHEGKLIKELVDIIMREQQHNFLPPSPQDLVGIDDRVAEVMKSVDITCRDIRIIGIWGMGGIGKTTLATTIYKKLFDEFKCHSFLKDIRETIKSKGIKHVQSLLILDITKGHERRVHDSEIGIGMIRSSCEKKKVLILLDDVERQDHLDNLIGDCNFELGSRIIITCRDMKLLKPEYERYELKNMDQEESWLLFSINAFKGERPPTELATLPHEIVATTGGLPLALKVIGSFLYGVKDRDVWKEMLKKLRNAPDKTVQGRLKLTYDTLIYEEQRIFKDIACFFIGIDKRIAIYLWEDLQLSPHSVLPVLIDRALIEIDDNNKLRMHDQLRDLGKAIACPKEQKFWRWSRRWDEEVIEDLLRCEEKNKYIEALSLDKRGSIVFMEQESFKKMPNLKFLHVNDVDFDGDFEGSLSKLRWLKCERCRGSSKATNVQLEKLVILDTIDSSFSKNWGGWSSIKTERLKVLNLSGSRLESTPNFSAFKNLEMLILEDCPNLKEIDPSIGNVQCLVSLNLHRCMGLEKLPEQLGQLTHLKTLRASWCSQLTEVPSSIGMLGELVELDLSCTWIKKLPKSIGKLDKLKILRIADSKIERLPSSIGKLQSLQEFDASFCRHLEGEIHVDEGGLSSLKTLLLGFSKISGLPENLDQLSFLEHLDLTFNRLQSLPKLPFSLQSLRFTCRSNEVPSLSHLNHLKELLIQSCNFLQSIPELPSCIRKLRVSTCHKLVRLPKLSHLEFLSELELVACHGLKKLDGLEALKSLRRLDLSLRSDSITSCGEELESIPKLPFSLSSLKLTHWRNELPSISHLNHLMELSLYHCLSFQSIELPSCIRKLHVCGCHKLETLPNLSDLEFLLELGLVECCGLKKLDGLEALKSLRKLNLRIGSCSNFDNLHVIGGLEKLRSLEELDISGRKHIKVLDLSKSEHLKYLTVENCKSLVEIRCQCKFLEYFRGKGCNSLKNLPDKFRHDF